VRRLVNEKEEKVSKDEKYFLVMNDGKSCYCWQTFDWQKRKFS
jgi:hypothetical protein